jgi:hypothetical protein
MRLVDIDDVRDGIKDSLGINIMLVYSGDKWEDILDSIPTAYDVDKVIKALQECADCPDLINSREDYLHAIGIVKRGGAKDF